MSMFLATAVMEVIKCVSCNADTEGSGRYTIRAKVPNTKLTIQDALVEMKILDKDNIPPPRTTYVCKRCMYVLMKKFAPKREHVPQKKKYKTTGKKREYTGRLQAGRPSYMHRVVKFMEDGHIKKALLILMKKSRNGRKHMADIYEKLKQEGSSDPARNRLFLSENKTSSEQFPRNELSCNVESVMSVPMMNQNDLSATTDRIDETTSHRYMSKMTSQLQIRELYPEPVIFNSGYLRVSDLHEIYYEESGNKDGNPVVHLHGGPGSGSNSASHRLFDPKKYHIIVFDQRGAGRSRPPGEIQENTTWELVADVDKLREHLSVSRWVVFGGSWGSTLSLLYAQSYPDRVKALILRGIFTSRRKELIWSFQEGGASELFPDVFEKFIAPIPETERHDLMSAYYRYLTGNDCEKRLECARAWSHWEKATSRFQVEPAMLEQSEDDVKILQNAPIECHYFTHGCFLKSDSQILDNVTKIRHIPAVIIQGRYDVVCPMDTAWQLHKVWPEAEFHIVADAGHSYKEAGIQTRLLDATDKFADL